MWSKGLYRGDEWGKGHVSSCSMNLNHRGREGDNLSLPFQGMAWTCAWSSFGSGDGWPVSGLLLL